MVVDWALKIKYVSCKIRVAHNGLFSTIVMREIMLDHKSESGLREVMLDHKTESG